MRTNFNPEVWGPYGWFFIESAILSYPDNPSKEDKNNFKVFLDSLSNILPCLKCRINYKNHLKNHPLNDKILSNKNNLLKWILKIHNLASNKKISLNKCIKFYNKKFNYKKSNKKNLNNNLYIKYLYFFIIFFLLILLYIFIKNK